MSERRIEVKSVANADGTVTVTATLFTPADMLAAQEEVVRRMIAENRLILLKDENGSIGFLYAP